MVYYLSQFRILSSNTELLELIEEKIKKCQFKIILKINYQTYTACH